MKKSMIVLGAAAAAAVAFTAYADETPAPKEAAKPEAAQVEQDELETEESPLFKFALQLDIKSAYVSHNRIYSDTPVAQYDIWGQINLPENFGWIGVDVWANQELNKKHSSVDTGNGGKRLGGIGEFDYEIVYGNSIGPVNLTASHLWYTYPRCGWTSQNFWTFGAEYDNEILVPSVKFYWEYCHENEPGAAFMFDFALSHTFQLTEELSLKLTSKTTLYTSEYADYLSGGEISRAAFGGWDNGVALSYAITDNLTIGGHLNFLYKLDHRVRHCQGWDSYSVRDPEDIDSPWNRTHDGMLYGGVSICFAF